MKDRPFELKHGNTRNETSGFQLVSIDSKVSELAVSIRREYRIALPDAIIWASAQAIRGVLITRNTRDFPAGHPGMRTPYSLAR